MVKKIMLPSGDVVLVDDEDYDEISGRRWWNHPSGHTSYAGCEVYDEAGVSRKIKMHRMILDAPVGAEVDHIDGNGLNNQRENLRLVTRGENACNRKRNENNKSGYKGVYWQKGAGKWHAQIGTGGTMVYLGLFNDLEEAAHAYDEAALQYHGEFARLNFKQ